MDTYRNLMIVQWLVLACGWVCLLGGNLTNNQSVLLAALILFTISLCMSVYRCRRWGLWGRSP